MAKQQLQHLRGHVVVKHVHGEAVAEDVRREVRAKPDAAAHHVVHRPGKPVTDRAIGHGSDGQGAALAGYAVRLKRLFRTGKQPAHLVHVGRI